MPKEPPPIHSPNFARENELFWKFFVGFMIGAVIVAALVCGL